jgi:PAS domain S-box-containing protein
MKRIPESAFLVFVASTFCVFFTLVVCSLYLQNRVVALEAERADTLKKLTNYADRVSHLGRLADAVSIPANRVFISKHPNNETEKLNQAILRFDTAAVQIQSSLRNIAALESIEHSLAKDLKLFGETVHRVESAARAAIASYREGNAALAVEHVAAMHGFYEDSRLIAESLQTRVRKEHDRKSLHDGNDLIRYERLMNALYPIMLVVSFAICFTSYWTVRKLKEPLGLEDRRPRAMEGADQTYRTLIENVPVGIMRMNQEGKITFTSRQWSEILPSGMKAGVEDCLGSVHPDDHLAVSQSYWEAFGDRSAFHREFRVKNGGTVSWVLMKGSATEEGADGHGPSYVSVVSEITDLKNLNGQLQGSVKELCDLKAALDGHAIVAVTDRKGVVATTTTSSEISSETPSPLRTPASGETKRSP